MQADFAHRAVDLDSHLAPVRFGGDHPSLNTTQHNNAPSIPTQHVSCSVPLRPHHSPALPPTYGPYPGSDWTSDVLILVIGL